MARCDAEAEAGRIPTNAAWWQVQRVFPIDGGPIDGGAETRVDGFFAQAVER